MLKWWNLYLSNDKNDTNEYSSEQFKNKNIDHFIFERLFFSNILQEYYTVLYLIFIKFFCLFNICVIEELTLSIIYLYLSFEWLFIVSSF